MLTDLRNLRERAGLTREQAAEMINAMGFRADVGAASIENFWKVRWLLKAWGPSFREFNDRLAEARRDPARPATPVPRETEQRRGKSTA